MRRARAWSSPIARRRQSDPARRRVDHRRARRLQRSWCSRLGPRRRSVRAGVGVSGTGASGSKSTNASDSRRPPTPSVIVWWIFCSSATRPSGSPSMSVNSQSGRARSSGCSASEAHRSSSARSELPSPGSATRRMCAVRSSVGSSANAGGTMRNGALTTRSPQPRDRRHGPRHRVLHAIVVGRVLEDRQVAEVGTERGVLLDRPHDRFGIRHAHWCGAYRRAGEAKQRGERRPAGGRRR